MATIHTMVGDVQAGDVDWGDQDSFVMRVKEPMDGSMNIRVVLKVRPPNEREKALPGGICVDVSNYREVKIGDREPFTFDVAFPMEVTQLEVFDRIGVDIVKTSYNGYNASMFAYGQTSSGKSFSMMGIRGTSLVGLIPRIADLLFHVAEQSPEREFFVEASYLEIYNERVRDLLDVDATDGLKIRESKQHGVHVVGLTKLAVADMDETMHLLDTGTSNRTVAATRYNTESSRSHSVFEMSVQQKYRDPTTGEEMQSKTKIALIDLAGSERSDRVGSTGKTLKEGNNINKSLTVLGRCIKALVEIAKNPAKRKKIVVPFRESVLTWYLRESLAGNARTTMLACCSPAASNIDETLSTLRYADSAKRIKTAAIKSEDPLKAKVRELTAEVQKLKAQLAGGGPAENDATSLLNLIRGGEGEKEKRHGELANMTEEERAEYMRELEQQMGLLGVDGFQQASAKQVEVATKAEEVFPQLSCLNRDDLLSHAMTVPINSESFHIGRSGVHDENDFELDGMGIQDKHCEITKTPAGWTIRALTPGAVVAVNGVTIEQGAPPVTLNHMDRVIFGPCRLLSVFLDKPMTSEERAQWTYKDAFRELTSGGQLNSRLLLSPKRQALVDQLEEIHEMMLKQANIIAAEMCTTVQFHAEIMMGNVGFEQTEITLDDLIECNQYRIVISCVAGTHTFKNANQVSMVRARKGSFTIRSPEVVQKKKKSNRRSSLTSTEVYGDLSKEHDFDAMKNQRLDASEESNWKNRELFEIDSKDFGDLLAAIKATHSNLTSLTGGLVDASGTGSIGTMVRNIFDAVDMDGSGVIDREELAAAIMRFDRNHDPLFLDKVLERENINETDADMNYQQFEEFLIKFLQHEFYETLEPYVTNKKLFAKIGGRVVTYTHHGALQYRRRSTRRGSVGSELSSGGRGRRRSSTLSMDQEGLAAAEEKANAEAERRAAEDDALLGLTIEEHKARANRRIAEHAKVQYFESVLLTDLKNAAHNIELLLRSQNTQHRGLAFSFFGSSSSQKKTLRTEKGLVDALLDRLKSSHRELEILQSATSHSSKHRSELERMVEALLESQPVVSRKARKLPSVLLAS
uniref:Uncharacterized protein n=1 Tax=Rhizochromulina marina TaxID=1034831 RepID=A0A7S2RC50_9STRA|mmetsp:Transcript_14198/g.41805  ORF Transcript_14198/g.41805 Transcript_14198/m.41805 type:complete len:1089 (+) Transcript_14198:97-3363(+)